MGCWYSTCHTIVPQSVRMPLSFCTSRQTHKEMKGNFLKLGMSVIQPSPSVQVFIICPFTHSLVHSFMQNEGLLWGSALCCNCWCGVGTAGWFECRLPWLPSWVTLCRAHHPSKLQLLSQGCHCEIQPDKTCNYYLDNTGYK